MKKHILIITMVILAFFGNSLLFTASSEYNVNCTECVKISKNKSANFNVNATTNESYLKIDYYSSGNLVVEDNIEIKVNGETLSEKVVTLPTYFYYDIDQFEKDRYGDEILPVQTVKNTKNSYFLRLGNGLSSELMKLDTKTGENKIEIKSLTNQISIEKVELISEIKVPSLSPTANQGELIEIEAENFTYKNSLKANAKYEASNYVTPSSSNNKLINVIDAQTFEKGGQSLIYEIEVQEDGYYNLAINANNEDESKLPIFLNVYVNDQIQDPAFVNYPLEERNGYSTYTIDQPMKLTKGKNEIKIELSIEPYAEILTLIDSFIQETQQINNDIIQITGGTVDENRDWQLTKLMPELKDDLQTLSDKLSAIQANLDEISGETKTEYGNSIDLMKTNIDELLRNADNIPNNMELLSSGSTSALSLAITLKTNLPNHPVAIDKLALVPYGQNYETSKPNVFQNMIFNTKVFFNSFMKNDEADLEYTTEINIWVKRPRQYVDILQKMADESFTPETKIKVNFSIMTDQNKIIMANAAGEQPDIVMGIDNWYAYELGVRGAFSDVNKFEQTAEITEPMSKGAMITMTKGDETYGIPETQDLNVMFYRTDLMNAYDVNVPQTWTEVLDELPKLQTNGMNFYLPFSGGSSLKAFPSTYPFFTQRNLSVYTEDGMQTSIDSMEAFESLQFMTDLYTLYGLPANIPNFYDSFREGTIPIGVANFSTYIQLLYAAPELSGNWKISTAPGIVDAEGNINNSMTGGQTVSSIMSQSSNQQQSIEFLQWWMETDTQIDYQQRLIGTYGPEYLWNSANREAFLSLPLDEENLAVFASALDNIIEPPKTPGGYYVERGISDIWNAVVFEGKNLKAEIDKQTDVINKELQRKYIEFEYMDENGEMISEYEIPTAQSITEAQQGGN